MRSTAEHRRTVLVDRAVTVFARNGYHATPVTAVAAAAGISEAYALRLFTNKLGLFLAAIDACYDRILATLEAAAETAPDRSPERLLEHLGDAYARLISDKSLLMLQVQAQSGTDIPEVKAAVQAGYKRLVAFLRSIGAGDAHIQQFIALGQLCHLIVTAGLDDVDESWARALTSGMTHVR
ncbi:TetR/AcrR family transcriptional regulator [Dactylosporangium sp. NPDC051541]|uniref:TetR/AcrR family transcriptional regulator n=1 Tax=Dactylosporangium sp. NPDC051541 TaxID=3363977 RepID=UPI003792667A